MDPIIRCATAADVEQLVEMRSDFSFEDIDPGAVARQGYATDCRSFLESAIVRGNRQIWVEVDDQIVSHVFVALIDKVPRPVLENRKIAYLTNVYTRPSLRGKGIGSQLLKRTQTEAIDAGVELMIVWPSEESVPFYVRLGVDVPETRWSGSR